MFHIDPLVNYTALKHFIDHFRPSRVKNLQIYIYIKELSLIFDPSKVTPLSTGADVARRGHSMAPAFRYRVKVKLEAESEIF